MPQSKKNKNKSKAKKEKAIKPQETTEASESKDQANFQNQQGRVTGRLKFFMEPQSFGFIIQDFDPERPDEPNPDLFFHFDDMKKTGLSRQFLKEARDKFIVRFKFRVMPYHGKYK